MLLLCLSAGESENNSGFSSSLFKLGPVCSAPARCARGYLALMPAPSADLTDLLQRCQRREPAAQHALYARYAGRMLGVARRYVRSVAEAEDILQDAFVKMFARLGEFRAEGSFEGWLRRIVVTTALNHWQSGQHRRQQVLLEDVPKSFASDADAFDRLTVAEVLALME